MIGTLNSKAMDDKGVMIARIDEKSYEVLSYVIPFLEKIETGRQVDATIKDDRITKIMRVKQSSAPMKQTSFQQAEEAMEKKEEQDNPLDTYASLIVTDGEPLPEEMPGEVISVTIGSTISLGNYSNIHLEVVATDAITARTHFKEEIAETVRMVRGIIKEVG